jgi:hypothetical protein
MADHQSSKSQDLSNLFFGGMGLLTPTHHKR